MKHVTVDHAARIIGVSSATIRNWEKAGYIRSIDTHPLSFMEETILNLKGKIASGSFGRLRMRANKAGSVNTVLPSEYAENSASIERISNLVAQFNLDGLAIEPLLFLAAFRLLESKGEVKRQHERDCFNLDSSLFWLRESVKSEMVAWRKSLKNIGDSGEYRGIYDQIIPFATDDFLGLIYRSLSSEGEKSSQGAYYTPTNIARDALESMTGPIGRFLDPCCGTGKYLLVAAKVFELSPKNIHGFDIDPIAVKIARLNLLLAFQKEEFSPNIECLDSLSELANGDMFNSTCNLIGKIDAIATNPPWGAFKNAHIPAQFEGKIRSGETYSMFLVKSIELLREGGQLSFLLPESILKIKTHSDIREIILNHSKITKITKMGRPFTGVFTPVIRMDATIGPPDKDSLVTVEENGNIHKVAQCRFKSNDHFAFDIDTATHEAVLLNRLYSVKHQTLFGHAQWALGIVTGDNGKYVLNSQVTGAEAVFRGGNVYPFSLGQPRSFIRFIPSEFQQTAPERFFRAPEKLVYKFISKRLVFAYDDKQRLTLNSANILIPSIPGMGIKVAMAFLNSAVFQYIFRKKFSTHKVLRGDLEKLPFPKIDQIVHDTLENLVNLTLESGEIPVNLEPLIFSTFNLTDEEVAEIKQESE